MGVMVRRGFGLSLVVHNVHKSTNIKRYTMIGSPHLIAALQDRW